MYSVKIKESAAKTLAKIPKPDRLRIIETIDMLKVNPLAGGTLKGEFSGLKRIRVGNYRVIYEANAKELIVLVIRIAHRREAYR